MKKQSIAVLLVLVLSLIMGFTPPAEAQDTDRNDTIEAIYDQTELGDNGTGDTANMPASLENGLAIGDVTINFDLNTAGNPAGEVLTEGVIDYGELADGTQILGQALDGGIAFSAVIDQETKVDDNNVARLAFDLDLPAGSEIVTGTQGAFMIITPTSATVIDPAIAFDAELNPVPAGYTIEDGHLVLSVDTSDAVFPIVADPSIWSCWGVARGIASLNAYGLIKAARKVNGCANFLSWGICRSSHSRWFGGWARFVVRVMTGGRYSRC